MYSAFDSLVVIEFDARCRIQIKADRKRTHERQLGCCKCRDRARIDSARQIGSDLHVTDELTINCLAKQTIELFDRLNLVERPLRLFEIGNPSSEFGTMEPGSPSSNLNVAASRQEALRFSNNVRSVKKF